MVVGVLMSGQINLAGATLKIASNFSRKKRSRKLLQKQACPLPLSHEKTSNNKEHLIQKKSLH